MNIYDPYANYEKIEFGNGLDAYVLHQPDKPFVHISAVIHSGCWHDPDDRVGLAHFTEHMVVANDGMDEAQLRRFFEDEGGHYHMVTSHLCTTYGFTAPSDDAVLRRFLGWLSRLCFGIEFRRYLKRERRIITSEYGKHIKIESLRGLSERRQRHVFTGTPLARSLSPLGNLPGITAIGMADIRDLYRRAYVPGNMSLVCTGGLSSGEAVRLLQDYPFVSNPGGCLGRRRLEPVLDPAVPAETRFEFSFKPGHETQTDYALDVLVPGSFNRQALGVFERMCDVLLFKELRERRHLVYAADSDSCYWERMFGALRVSAENFETFKLPDVEAAVRYILESFPRQRCLFASAKHACLMSSRVQDMSLLSAHRDVCDMLATGGRIRTDAEDVADLQSVEFDDVCRLVEMLLGNRAVATVFHS